MKQSNQSQTKRVVEPGVRGGAVTEVISPKSPNYVQHVLNTLRYDQNLVYLTARLQNYSDVTEARMLSLSQAIDEKDHDSAADLAQALTDSTGKLGAIRMMKLCIALQMLARRGLTDKAQSLFAELQGEYERFKQTLISAVG
jgi:HPt (histidine-containing phosphotransfer) domain-containing protein